MNYGAVEKRQGRLRPAEQQAELRAAEQDRARAPRGEAFYGFKILFPGFGQNRAAAELIEDDSVKLGYLRLVRQQGLDASGAQDVGVKALAQRKARTEDARAADTGAAELVRGGGGDVQQGYARAALYLGRELVYGVRADDEEVRAGARERPRLLR